MIIEFYGGLYMPQPIKTEIMEDIIKLQREQWKGNTAYISNYPGLLDEVKKYTWTYSTGEHPYLNCSTLKISLHKFVLQFLYGKENLDKMLGEANIIEHLDNDGLNCSYENLHVLSADMNKAKAFSIDKQYEIINRGNPALITDVYYSHKNKYYQLQVFFNKNIVFNKKTNRIVESFTFQYNDFNNLFIDWLYCIECIKKVEFDVYKHHAIRVYAKEATLIELREDEKNAVIVKRNGSHYIIIRTDPQNGPVAFMDHISFKDFYEKNQ